MLATGSCYILLGALVVFFSARLGFYVDQLDRRTPLSSAFIGGVLLAAVTSLPELFTSLTASLSVEKPELVLGNLLGSDLYNMLVLGLVFLVWLPGLRRAVVTRSHLTTLRCTLAVYLILLLSLFTGETGRVGPLSLISLLIFGFYLISVRTMAEDEDTSGSKPASCPFGQIIVGFAFYAVMLIAASVMLTHASDRLAGQLHLDDTVAGALLLGIVTSVPELISCIVLARAGNFNAVAGNIVGSGIFNMAILLPSDLAYRDGEIYAYDEHAAALLILGVVSALSLYALIGILSDRNGKRPLWKLILLSVIPVLCYGAFLAAARG